MRPKRREQPGPGQLSVWDFPRPPDLVQWHEHVVVTLAGVVVAETTRPAEGTTVCEWKGTARYLDVVAGAWVAPRSAWTYPSVAVADVRQVVEEASPGSFDPVLLDVDNGPDFVVFDGNSQIYESSFLDRVRLALRPGGCARRLVVHRVRSAGRNDVRGLRRQRPARSPGGPAGTRGRVLAARRPKGPLRGGTLRVTLAAVTAITALVAAPATAATAATPTGARLASSSHDLYLDFNGGTGDSPDLSSSGSAPVTTGIASSGGGTVVAEPKGAGKVARLEPFDPDTPAQLAAVVVRPAGDADPFAPRRDAFTFGATFKLDPKSQGSTVDNGNNLVQRGLYADDAQYKIQVDGSRVSCRVGGSAGAVLVKASVLVDPGAWYRTRCTRNGTSVKLVLVKRTADGPVTRSWTRSGAIGDLAFSAEPPLSVGGKVNSSGALVTSSADQFNGRVDDVFFRRIDG